LGLPPLCDKWGLPVFFSVDFPSVLPAIFSVDFPSDELSFGSAGGFSLGFLLMITVRLPSTLPAHQKSR
jgi:hypothetical protein